jgi:cell division protein FtsX
MINPMPFALYVSLAILGIGAVVGMFGSYTAVRKYLKI